MISCSKKQWGKSDPGMKRSGAEQLNYKNTFSHLFVCFFK